MTNPIKRQEEQERERALQLLAHAQRLIDAHKGSLIYSIKKNGWLYAWHSNGSTTVTELKTGRLYAASKPGDPLSLDEKFKPVSLATP